MGEMSVSEARASWAVVDVTYLDWLSGLVEHHADIDDARAARNGMAETGEPPIPWDQAKAELGLA
jgi:hypothetical protein